MPLDRAWLRAAVFASCLLPGAALAFQTGTYRCFSHDVSGDDGSCRDVRPLRINADESWTDGAGSGTWRLGQDGIALVGGTRGPGRLVGGDRIVFEYTDGDARHVVTYLCSDACRELESAEAADNAGATAAAPKRPPAEPAAPPTRVRLGLTLLFPAASDALVEAGRAQLVPADRAAAYRDPQAKNPPPGSSAGEITARSGDTLDLTFQGVGGGVAYVLFLETESGRVEASAFEVPRSPAEQTMFVSASLGEEEPAGEEAASEAEEPAAEPEEAPKPDDGATRG